MLLRQFLSQILLIVRISDTIVAYVMRLVEVSIGFRILVPRYFRLILCLVIQTKDTNLRDALCLL